MQKTPDFLENSRSNSHVLRANISLMIFNSGELITPLKNKT